MREAVLAAGAAASLAALLFCWGPGNDLAAHVYQRTVFLHDGFQLWNNFWYGGRYAFVTYSVLYYPLGRGCSGSRRRDHLDRDGGARVRGRRLPAVGTGRPLVEPDVRRRLGRPRHLAAFPFAPGDRARPARDLGAPGGKALLRRARSPDRRRKPACLPPDDLLAGCRPRHARARPASARPDADRRGIGLCQFLVTRAFADGGHTRSRCSSRFDHDLPRAR